MYDYCSDVVTQLVCLGFGTGVKCQLSWEAFASLYSELERKTALLITKRSC